MELPKLSRTAQRRFKTSTQVTSLGSNVASKKLSLWQEVKKFGSEKSKSNEKILQDLWNKTKDLTSGEESPELVDDLAVFLIRLFLGEKFALPKHITQMKTFFGEVSSKQANDFHRIVKLITIDMNEEEIERLKQMVNESSALDTESCNIKKPFGSSIKFVTREYIQDVSHLNNLIEPTGFCPKSAIDKFSMSYTQKKESNVDNGAVIYDKFWILRKIKEDHFVDPLISIVKSQRSNDEIQNELFELLGFDKFEIIQEILENRANLVKNFNMLDKKEELTAHQVNLKKQAALTTKPAPDFLMPVLVQSEKERELQKLARKDEKKLKNVKPSEMEEDDLAMALRLSETQQQISKVQSTPILSSSASTMQYINRNQPRYPFVFDETKEAKAHIGFLANTKIMLPADTERKNNQMCEEVSSMPSI